MSIIHTFFRGALHQDQGVEDNQVIKSAAEIQTKSAKIMMMIMTMIILRITITILTLMMKILNMKTWTKFTCTI